uniref:Integrin, alpha 9 n=1 Tax=Callorhinchus milii TaxID=7868 RepID=A0A4W3IVD4_CALMI
MKPLLVCVALICFGSVCPYNIDLDHPVVFRGTNGTFFGYSVLQHFHDNTRWVLVGAPNAESTYSRSMRSPGAVFKCRIHSNPERRCTELDLGRGNQREKSCGKTCKEDRDNEWMGVSLSRQQGGSGSILACAHRWKNIHYQSEHILPHGACYIIPPNLYQNTKELLPCYQEYKKTYGEEHGSCQAGIAGHFVEDLVVMGAPGSYYWTGTVKVYNLKDKKYYNFKDSTAGSTRYRYLGFAVATGHFTHPSSLEIVGGAPRDADSGKVWAYSGVAGPMGSYFGSSLCAVDLNSDGYTDLLVGAPMFTKIRDEGQVTVFINRGNAVLEEKQLLLGDSLYNAHFGESIASLGDIDDDGFPDVAIGAPNENDYVGAVYIYHGDADGIVSTYSMRLSGKMISPLLRMFDGSQVFDSVASLADSRPVITVEITILLPESLNITAPQCHDGFQPVTCLNVSTCFRFHGKEVPGEIELIYNLTADTVKKERGLQSRVYISASEPVSQVTEKIELSSKKERCERYFVIREVKDVISPIVFEVTYSLGKHIIGGKDDKELPALKPILRWKKGHKLAQRNQEGLPSCLHEETLLTSCFLISSSMEHKPFLALGAVKNISVNITIRNAGDDAYDTNVFFNFSQELFFIKMWQKEEKGTSCELLESDFLKCSVGFPFMRSQSKVHLNDLDTAITGSISPTSFIYGSTVDVSKFIQMEDCLFQPLNFTFQVINMGPSSVPELLVQIMIPSKLSASGADMFLIQETVGGNCTFHRNPQPCFIPQDRENIFHTIFAFFTKSGRKIVDCDRSGRPCQIIKCKLNSIAKEETRNIDVRLLLNTEILKKDSASVIQFVTRAKGTVSSDRRTVEVAGGLPEDSTVVFEALHNLEPRGYVVGWIIAISLFVGILIFLLLAVLLWKLGFFRRKYKEIIEAEKNRKDSEESWNWVQKDQ